MLKKILSVLFVIVIFLAAVVMLQPGEYRVERSIEIAASAESVFSQISDLRSWPTWSPWAKRDPAMKMTYSDITTGVGAFAAWESESEGRGNQSIMRVVENQSLHIDLEFIAPFEARAKTDFNIQPRGERSSILTWGMDGSNDGFIGKMFYFMLDFDKMIGTDYETGLQAIKQLSESMESSDQ